MASTLAVIIRIRNSAFNKVLWVITGLLLLNISVDTTGLIRLNITKGLAFNDQESIVEIVVEKILGHENAIPEFDNYDGEDHNNKTNIRIDLIARFTVDFSISETFGNAVIKRFPDLKACLSNGFHQLDIPPPKI